MKKNFLARIFFFQFGLITLRLNWWILLKKISPYLFFFWEIEWVSYETDLWVSSCFSSATVVAHPNSSVVCWVQRINRHILCTWQTISLIIDVLVLHPTDKPDSWAKFRSQKVMKTSSPTSKRSTENSLWGWFFVCVYFFRSENNVEYLWKWHTAQWQMPKLSTIWIAISDNYSFNTDKIPDRFMIPNWAPSVKWVNSLWQTVRHVSQAQNVTTQKLWLCDVYCPQNFWFLLWNSSVCSSGKFWLG